MKPVAAITAAVLALSLTSCGPAGGAPQSAGTSTSAAPPTSAPPESATTTIAPATSTAPATTTRPATTHPATTIGAPARFSGAISAIDADERARLVASGAWREGCPVALDDLRLLTFRFWGFDGGNHQGQLMVSRDAAAPVLRVMGRLFDAGFPLRRAVLVEAYGADDDRSMAADNTSAFNCRVVPGSQGSWSQHAYGRAVDLNPVENPEVRVGVVSPPAGSAYLDRSRGAAGMITAGGPVVAAFAAEGWGWGGAWHSLKDYQHFSANGL